MRPPLVTGWLPEMPLLLGMPRPPATLLPPEKTPLRVLQLASWPQQAWAHWSVLRVRLLEPTNTLPGGHRSRQPGRS